MSLSQEKTVNMAVQIRSDDDLNCSVFYGKPITSKEGKLGKILLFNVGSVVFYIVKKQGKSRGYLIHYLGNNDGVLINGIYPKVDLLVEARTRGKVTRLKKVIQYLLKNGYSLEDLSRDFYFRLNTLIEGKTVLVRNIKELLKHEKVDQLQAI